MLDVMPTLAGPTVISCIETMSDDDLHTHYLECRRRERIAAAASAEVLAEIERRRSYRHDGYLTASAFVAHHTGDPHRTAAGRVRLANALGDMPETSAAFRDGDLDVTRVRRLINARETAPEPFACAEPDLVEQARTADAKGFATTIELWLQRVSLAAVRADERERFERRRLTVFDTLDGMVHLEGDLDPVSAETVITAIGGLAGPANRDGGDGRTPTQRRADALTEICRRFLDGGEAPISGRQTPHLRVIVDIDALTGGPPRRSEIGHRRALGPAAREMLACDATVCGVLLRRGEEILTMGRSSRTATPAQFRALAVRDGGCVVPGCDRPPDWCDAHHIVPWIQGGVTDVNDMVLVCRPHHVMHHLGSLRLPQRE
ncbi:DUF222 domain-containing protein [bacterium]|nr:DUF222 domain-containing protein [bacterium]